MSECKLILWGYSTFWGYTAELENGLLTIMIVIQYKYKNVFFVFFDEHVLLILDDVKKKISQGNS